MVKWNANGANTQSKAEYTLGVLDRFSDCGAETQTFAGFGEAKIKTVK